LVTTVQRWLERLSQLGLAPDDPDDVRTRKVTLTLASEIVTVLSVIWVGTYLALGHPLSAAIPFGYQVASVLSLLIFARTKDFRSFRFSQIILILALPFVLQWSLGGYIASSTVSLWALVGVFGALFFYSARGALPWFLVFVGLTVVSGLVDRTMASHAAVIPSGIQVAFFVLNVLGVALTAFLLLQYSTQAREDALARSAGPRPAYRAPSRRRRRRDRPAGSGCPRRPCRRRRSS
jgi:hypothetical protein